MARSSYAKRGKERSEHHEDPFVERLLQASAWAQDNLTVVVVATVILAAGVAGILYYRSYQQTVREQAAVRLQDLAASLPGLDPAVAADTLRSFVDRYRGTQAADEARALLGRVRLDEGQPAEAIEILRPALERGPDTPVGFAARMLLAAAHEMQGEVDAALRIYAELGEAARLPFQRRRALADRARLLAEQGRFEEAAAIYGELAERAEEAGVTAEAADYRLRHGETAALAAARGSGPPPEEADGGATGGPDEPADPAGAPGGG